MFSSTINCGRGRLRRSGIVESFMFVECSTPGDGFEEEDELLCRLWGWEVGKMGLKWSGHLELRKVNNVDRDALKWLGMKGVHSKNYAESNYQQVCGRMRVAWCDC